MSISTLSLVLLAVTNHQTSPNEIINVGTKTLTNDLSTEQLKSQNQALLEKLGGGVLTKDIETEMKKIIEAHVSDFTA